MKKDQLISSRAYALCVGVVVFCASLPSIADGETEISRVSLTVQDGATNKPTAGLLFRVFPDGTSRKHVADIDASGKTDRPVKCAPQDKFEAQADSKLDLPLPPPRKSCAQALAFGFTRMFVTVFPPDYASPLANTSVSPKLYSQYAEVFAAKGKSAVALTFSDATKIVTAEKLGDIKFDRYLYRDSKKGYALEFTPSGVAALKAKQVELGVTATGQVDAPTVDAFAKKGAWITDVGALECKVDSGRYRCEPLLVEAKKMPGVVVLPEVKF